MADPTKPKKKSIRWLVLFVFTGVIDLAQILVDFTGVGVIASEIAEVIMPFVLIGLMTLFGISLFKRPMRIASMAGVAIGDAITGGIAPFWILDIWYIYSDVKKEEAAAAEQAAQESMLSNMIRQPLYKDGSRQPQQKGKVSAPIRLNNKGIRAPGGGLGRK